MEYPRTMRQLKQGGVHIMRIPEEKEREKGREEIFEQ